MVVIALRIFLLTGLLLCAASAQDPALSLKPQLGQPFRDNAVLQREMAVPVWGTSLPGASVTVAFDGQNKATIADGEGKWRLKLDAMEAVKLKSVKEPVSGKTMTITCEKDGKSASLELSNLVVGDVWICAGQSNMAGSMRRAVHAKNYPSDSIPKADYPSLRHYSAKEDQWLVCTPETAVDISRVGFYFIRRVQQDALIPMGVIVTAVGGSRIETWLNQPPYGEGGNYTELLKPHVGYGIKGVVWYQGESNQDDKRAYQPKLKSLIEGWRKAWGQGDFPFHYVQLPGIRTSERQNPAGGDGRAEIRQAYTENLALPNTGMAVTIDLGTPGEHPPNKYDTGVRLARSVLREVYDVEVTACPLYAGHEIEGDSIRVSFTQDAKDGLMIARKADPAQLPDSFLPPKPMPDAKIDWLAIQATDGSWHWADGRIEGAELVVSAEGVKDPIAVRYAYTDQPYGTLLYNKDGMPVGPFTTCGYDPKQPE